MHDLRKDTVAYADHILSEAFHVGFYDFLKKGSGLPSVHSIGSAHWLALHSLRTGSGLLFLVSMSLNVDRKRFVYLLLSFTNLAQDTDIFRLETYLIIKVPFIFGQCAT